MSAPENPDDKKDLNKTQNANPTEPVSTEDKDEPAESKSAATNRKADPTADNSKKQKPTLSARKDPAEEPTKIQPNTPRRAKHALIAIAAVAAVILIGGPALFALCLSETSPSFDSAVAPNGAPIACPTIAGHFDECYLTEEITISVPPESAKTGFEKFCCDTIVDRTLVISAYYKDASGALPNTLNAAENTLRLEDGARLTGNPVLLSGGVMPQRSLSLVAQPVFSMPMLTRIDTLLGEPTDVLITELISTIAPNAIEAKRLEKNIPLTKGGTMVRVSDGAPEFQQISIRARTSASRLFSDILSNGMNAAQILTEPETLQFGTSGRLMRSIVAAQPPGNARIRAAYDALRSQSASRIETGEEASIAQQKAGRACIAFYDAMRRDFSRFDAAVATYVAAKPTGLLTALSPEDRHGCSDSGAAALSSDLAADWLALDAPMTDLVMVSAEQTKAEPATTAQGAVAKLLLDFASAAKSGARIQDIKAAINDPVAIRFGRKGEAASGSRDAVLRMLHQQWAHVGCWIYASTPNAGGRAMLLAEAQYPYLNRIVLGFSAGGQVEKVEVTGVTFDDILRFKAANRGRNCQQFLNSVRLADYRDWYADNPTGTPTPSDHAERLFHEGLKRKLRLN